MQGHKFIMFEHQKTQENKSFQYRNSILQAKEKFAAFLFPGLLQFSSRDSLSMQIRSPKTKTSPINYQLNETRTLIAEL